MIAQIETTTVDSGAAIICEICHTKQHAPPDNPTQWRCGMCGQEYRSINGGNDASILLSERQLAALRTLAGRDTSGRSTLVKNWWSENDQPAGETFLDWNKDMPSRHLARKLITDWAAAGQIQSVLEIAFGGLHEYRAMRERLKELNVSYAGIDWTEHFVAHAQNEFPECRWTQGDIVRGVSSDPADVVYSQHMLEHVPALEPAFSNMLRLARKKLINIFFIPPKPFANYDVVNWEKLPRYHNTYGIGHIEKICRSMDFTCNWVPFEKNPVFPGVGLGQDVVLICERQIA
jgi:SAM-dependent methyltransferase